MSENIPESIPTSRDSQSHRPTKRQAVYSSASAHRQDPSSIQSAKISALFANPTQEVKVAPTGPNRSQLAAPPEIATNVQGSSAGAGSGEFHVYKASRRRENERLRLMDEQKGKEEADKEYDGRREEMRRLDDEKTERNRAKREKARARKGKATKGGKASAETESKDAGPRAKVKANVVPGVQRGEDDDDPDAAANDETEGHAEQGIVIHDDD